MLQTCYNENVNNPKCFWQLVDEVTSEVYIEKLLNKSCIKFKCM